MIKTNLDVFALVTKREIDVDDWVKIVVEQGFEALPDSKNPISDGEIPPNPLEHIILPAKMTNKDINYIFLIKQNYILLRTTIYYDGSKIAQEALNRFSFAVWRIRQRYPYLGSN